MATSTRIIRRRLRSISSTRKVTKAMELVSAAKMRRAIEAVHATRPYARTAWDILARLAQAREGVAAASALNALLVVRPVKRVAVIAVSSNRGLAGAFNIQIANTIDRAVRARYVDLPQAPEIVCVTLGSKGRDAIARMGMHIAADFPKSDITRSAALLSPVWSYVLGEFANGAIDEVLLVYTDFISTLTSTPVIRKLLPITESADQSVPMRQTIFEPDAQEVLETMLPKLLELELYQAVLESEASEHSARMVAMKNASDAAEDMMDELTLAYNQARQSGITREMLEISSGKAALSSRNS